MNPTWVGNTEGRSVTIKIMKTNIKRILFWIVFAVVVFALLLAIRAIQIIDSIGFPGDTVTTPRP